MFRYNVEGEALPNPYRLRPLVGVKMPVNSSYSPVIQIHNPHPTTIQVQIFLRVIAGCGIGIFIFWT